VMDGCKETGVTVQHLALKLDTGNIILQERVAVSDEDTAETLLAKCAEIGAPMLYETINRMLAGNAPEIEQNDADATYAHKITREDGYIDWSRTARQIYNQVRACTPWPGTTTWNAGTAYKILKARLDNEIMAGEEPGTLIPSKKHLKVSTAKGILEILEIQPSNKGSMTGAAFLAGHRMRVPRFEAQK
jgi:methionyl-tRNA formyltransferase